MVADVRKHVSRVEKGQERVCYRVSDHLGRWVLVLLCNNKKWLSAHTSDIPPRGEGAGELEF